MVDSTMIKTSTAEVWECTICSWVWFKRIGKTPKRCPNAKCRKLSSTAPAVFGGEPKPAEIERTVGPIRDLAAKDKLSELRKLVSAIKPEPYQDETAVEASAWECPICDKPLVRYMKRGINFGKLACAECDQAWSEAQLKRR